MSDNRSPVLDLVMQTFGLAEDAISREALDHEWAPVERWHLRAADPDGLLPRSVVVKTRRTGGTGWGYDYCNLTAEHRALDLLASSGLAPRVYAADDELGVIVMEDVADAHTVERVLFADDPVVAEASLVRLASTFGQMHAFTAPTVRPLDPTPWNPAAPLVDELPAAWETIQQATQMLAMPVPSEAANDEIPTLEAALADPTWRALVHGDAFPSNTLLAGDRMVLIDFEGANPRHIAIDGACFALAFPAYRYWADLAVSLTTVMVEAWRSAIARSWPQVEDDAVFYPMLATGALTWTIVRLSRLARLADESEPPDEQHRRRSQIVQTTAATIRVCRSGDAYPALASWLEALNDAISERWPESRHPRHYPAFNGGNRDGWVLVHDI